MLVHSVQTDYPLHENEYYPGQPTLVATKYSYFVKDNAVSKIYSQKISGLNRHSRNRYYRWQTQSVSTVYRTKSGRIAGRHRAGKSWTASLALHAFERDDFFKQAVVDKFGVEPTLENAYPLASHYGVPNEMCIPGGLRNGLRQETLGDLLNVTFGKTRYRKDLAKAVAKASPNAIAYARDFRGLVPIDWIVNFLRANEGTPQDASRMGVKSLRPVLLQIDPRSYRDLLRQTLDGASVHSIIDILHAPVVPGRYRTIHQMHDSFYEAYRQNMRQRRVLNPVTRVYEPPTPKEIPQTPIAQSIDGVTAGEFVIRTAKDTGELHNWGEEMRNCIGSYGYAVTGQHASQVLGGIYQGEKLIANFEITDRRLGQLLGKCNNPLDAETRRVIEAAFNDKKIETKTYWGSDDRLPF